MKDNYSGWWDENENEIAYFVLALIFVELFIYLVSAFPSLSCGATNTLSTIGTLGTVYGLFITFCELKKTKTFKGEITKLKSNNLSDAIIGLSKQKKVYKKKDISKIAGEMLEFDVRDKLSEGDLEILKNYYFESLPSDLDFGNKELSRIAIKMGLK